MRARARKTDPSTSHEAAARAEKTTAAAHREKCLSYVFLDPGHTAAEIAKAIGIDRYAASRRLPELRDTNRIENRMKRICKILGSWCITWYPASKENQKRLF